MRSARKETPHTDLFWCGVHLNKQDIYGETALNIAINQQHADCIKLLKAAGAKKKSAL